MSVRNLGLILDNTLGMEKQVNSICKSCYYQIRNIRVICMYINDETWKTSVQALIISQLDYGNALLYNIPPISDNLPVLFQLQWLPVHFRSLHKILFHTFKVLNGTAPVIWSKNIYQWECTDLNPIHFWGYQEAIQQYTERDPSEHQLPDCGTSCRITLNSQQVKTYFVSFLKSIYLNWRIYNIKPVYYVWNEFDL